MISMPIWCFVILMLFSVFGAFVGACMIYWKFVGGDKE